MANAFFKLTDHRYGQDGGVSVRLSEIVSVTDPKSDRADWVVHVAMRQGEVHTMSGDINSIYRKRDELMHALEQDAAPLVTKAIQRRRETPAGDTASERAFGR